MAGYLPPPPTQNPDTSTRIWQDWYRQLQKYLTGISTLDWSLLDLTDAALSDIPDRDHNDLLNFDGGTTGEYYHLTSAQHTDLTDGGATTLHKHDHGGQDGLTDDDHTQYWNAARGAARVSLRI